MIRLVLLFLISVLFSLNSFSITWDEPWQEEVFKKSDYFVLGYIKKATEKEIVIEVIRNIGTSKLKGELIIDCFSMLHTCSGSGNDPEFNANKSDTAFFYLTKSEKNNYCLPTPTIGVALVKKGQVYATYRHSYHQASVPFDIYEKTCSNIWEFYKKGKFDEKYVNSYIEEQLSLPPAGFEKNEIGIFFKQHVALEMIYHLQLNSYYDQLVVFLKSNNVHHQISAARALRSYQTDDAQLLIINSIADSSFDNFTKVMLVWSLKQTNPKKYKDKIEALVAEASSESNGFGGDIMDPRICTYIPDVKKALTNLVAEL
jgi:hypothetical protein